LRKDLDGDWHVVEVDAAVDASRAAFAQDFVAGAFGGVSA